MEDHRSDTDNEVWNIARMKGAASYIGRVYPRCQGVVDGSFA